MQCAEILGWSFADSLERTGRAAILFELGRDDEAANERQRAMAIAERTQNHLAIYNCAMVGAYHKLRRGDHEGARAPLSKALQLGSRHGMLGCAWLTREALSVLCAEALEGEIEPQQAATIIGKLQLSPTATSPERWPGRPRIYALGRLEVVSPAGAQAARPSGTPLRLLELLLAWGGDAPQERVADILWPDAEGDAGRRAFDTTLHRLRRIVGDPRALPLVDGRLTLDRQRCWADVWEVEAVLRRLSALLDAAQAPAAGEVDHLGDRLCALYQGPFLNGRALDCQTEARRRRLHRDVLRALEALVAHAKRIGVGAGVRVLDRLRSLADDDSGPIGSDDSRRLPDIGLARASTRR